MMIDKDQEKDRTLVENTAQAVRNHLMGFNSNRAHVITRWIWELLQNARDTSPQGDTDIVASIERRDGVLVFQHNGRDFSVKEISHLIFHGSTKAEDLGTVGQYGSGFLTTHLLSPTIEVSGKTDEGETFKFRLFREISSVESLKTSMDRAWEDFKTSATYTPDSTKDAFTTQFRYPLDDTVVDVVEDGISSLRKCAPFVMVFNRQFDCIVIEDQGKSTKFKVTGREILQEGLQKVTVERNENGERIDETYILAESEKASIAVPIKVTDGEWECLRLGDIPRLFLGFPLIDTETFSFPAVINSFDFTPKENRDGVALWQNENDLANQKNQAVIEEACQLHLKFIRYAATSNAKRVHVLASIPPIPERDWLNKERFRECLGEQLIEPMRRLPITVCEYGLVAPMASYIPYTKNVANNENLWDLLSRVKYFREKLPTQKETLGWREAVDSWAAIVGNESTGYEEAIDGTKLAEYIQIETKPDIVCNGTLDDLQSLLIENISVVEWLNQLHQFLADDGFDDVIEERYLVLDQDGNLDQLSNLYRDDDINDKVKDIADNLGLQCRPYLRDRRLTALKHQIGKGNRDNEDIVREITEKLRELANDVSDEGLCDVFIKASVDAFGWIVGAEKWQNLGDFPTFSRSSNEDGRKVLWLSQHYEDDSDIPFAPVKAWPEELQEYAELFPRQYILADAFFKAIPEAIIWRTLSDEGFVKTSVIVESNDSYSIFLPSEPLRDAETVHKTVEQVALSDVAFFIERDVGITERVRKSQPRARLLWRFLTQWLTKNDPNALEVMEAVCECGETHGYFPARWLEPLAKNKWVPVGNDKSDRATARSLATLLRGEQKLSYENPTVTQLLRAIGVSPFDLTREFMISEGGDREAVESTLVDFLNLVEGDLTPVREFLEDLKTDDNLPTHLAERRKRLQIVHDNQRLGKRVEELVRETLEGEGFIVTPIHVGSDLKIELPEPHDVASLQLIHKNRSWFVEVKATRGDSYVRMTEAQARKAVEEDNRFLLCVIPVEADVDDLEESGVKAHMHFVENIGSRLGELHKDIDWLKSVRGEVTNKEHSGVQLEVVSGIARVRVSDSLWNSEGFPIEDLTNRIK